MSLGPPDNGLHPGNQLAPVERLRQIVVSAEAKALDLVIQLGKAGKNKDRCLDLRATQAAQNLIAVEVWQHKIEENDVVVIEPANFEAVFSVFRHINHKPFGFQHELNALGCGEIVFYQEYAHGTLPL